MISKNLNVYVEEEKAGEPKCFSSYFKLHLWLWTYNNAKQSNNQKQKRMEVQ